MSGRLGELLVRENLISVQQLRKAQEEQQKSGARIGTALIKTGAIEESKLTDFLSKQYGVPAINLKDFDIDPEIIRLVSKEVAEKHLVIPVNRDGPARLTGMTRCFSATSFDTRRMISGSMSKSLRLIAGTPYCLERKSVSLDSSMAPVLISAVPMRAPLFCCSSWALRSCWTEIRFSRASRSPGRPDMRPS